MRARYANVNNFNRVAKTYEAADEIPPTLN